MQADDLACLCNELYKRLPYRGSEMADVIFDVRWKLKDASETKIDKVGERRVKEILYKIETLFRNIEKFMEESQLHRVVGFLMEEIQNGKDGQYSRFIGKPLQSSIASQMKLLTKELKPFSEKDKSLILRETIIGAEFNHKKEELIELLLNSNSGPIIAILGKPGTGKSTLVWHALDDSRVQKYFNCKFPRRFQSGGPYYESNGNRNVTVVEDASDFDDIESLLSLDEDTLLSLEFFRQNAKGSKMLFISTLQLDPERMAPSNIRVPSLGDDESWILFQKIAFKDSERPHSTLVDIARKIFHKCGNIPGVINFVASILSSKSTAQEWEHFLYVVMASVPDPITTIASTIEFTKLLHPQKKYWGHRFAWCSLLPKDHQFQKNHLFHLWRAQEIFRDINDKTKVIRSKLENQLEPCFNEFLRRGYFLEGNTIGSTDSYKINHLAFELMKYVAGDDFCLVDKDTPEPNHKIIRHASFIVDPSWQPPSWLPKAKQLQSLLLWPRKSGEYISLSKIGTILSRMTHLRALHAEVIHCERLPDFLVEFKRLEYLRFGVVSSVSLPEDIPALLKLLICDIRYNSILEFALNGKGALLDENVEQEQRLALLIKLVGFKNLTIQYNKFFEQNFIDQTHKIMGSLNLQSTSFGKNDWETFLNFRHYMKEESKPSRVIDELSIEQTHNIIGFLNLQSTSFSKGDWEQTFLNPHQTVESLKVRHWKIQSLPPWVIDESSVFLNGLLSIQIANCDKCKHLPGFNTLPHLSSLQLGGMCSLVNIIIGGGKSKTSSTKPFYPSLVSLVLCDLPQLTGWVTKEADDNQNIREKYNFPLLTQVRVQGCSKLNSVPLMPMMESLEAININAKIVNHLLRPSLITPSLSEDIQESAEISKQHFSLSKSLKIDGIALYWGDKLNDVEKGDWRSFRSLRSLKLANNPEMESLPRDLKCIMMLEHLSLCRLTHLKVLPEWIGQLTQLRELTIHYCPKLKMLPNAHGSFSTLEQLEIRYCPRLSQFPESLPNLKSLRVQEFVRLEQILCGSQNLDKLEINNCDELEWATPRVVEGDVSVNVWESLNSLHTLKLTKIDVFPKGLDFAKLSKLSRLVIEKSPKLTSLPDSLCSLSTLQHLQINYCPGLITLPENFKKLGSIKKLEIRVSPQLEKKCKPDGENWSLIKHIPNIVINDSPQQSVA